MTAFCLPRRRRAGKSRSADIRGILRLPRVIIPRGVNDMIVYWDLVAAWNFSLDYLLLLCTLRLAGRPVRRRRLLLGAALGSAYAVVALILPFSPWLLLGTMALVCLVAFGWERWLKLTLLFVLLSCSLCGAVLLLGHASGSMERLSRGMVYAELPWEIFFGAALGTWTLLALVFRGGARRGSGDYLSACVELGGKKADVTLLRDTGNTLTDPLTGEGVPVIERAALSALPIVSERRLNVTTALGSAALPAFRCDILTVDGHALGARLIALTDHALDQRCQGLWFDEGKEAAEQYELQALLG